MDKQAQDSRNRRFRDARIESIKAFIQKNIDRPVAHHEVASIARLSNQTLHLLAAACDEARVQ